MPTPDTPPTSGSSTLAPDAQGAGSGESNPRDATAAGPDAGRDAAENALPGSRAGEPRKLTRFGRGKRPAAVRSALRDRFS